MLASSTLTVAELHSVITGIAKHVLHALVVSDRCTLTMPFIYVALTMKVCMDYKNMVGGTLEILVVSHVQDHLEKHVAFTVGLGSMKSVDISVHRAFLVVVIKS